MTINTPLPAPLAIAFKTIEELNKFKKECNCDKLFKPRDLLSIIGSFSEKLLNLATSKYNAIVSIDRRTYEK